MLLLLNRKTRHLGIALLVIGGVIGLIALSVYTLTEDDLGKRIKGDRIRLEDIVDSRFRPRTFNGTWISDSELIYSSLGGGGVSIMDVASGKTKTLMSNSTFVSMQWSQPYFRPFSFLYRSLGIQGIFDLRTFLSALLNEKGKQLSFPIYLQKQFKALSSFFCPSVV